MIKKTFILLAFALLTIQSFGQFQQENSRTKSIPYIQSIDASVSGNFVWHGDTINFNDFSKIFNRIEYEDNFLKFYATDSIIDSVLFTYTVDIDTFDIQDYSLRLFLSNGSQAFVNIADLKNKLDSVNTGYGITGNGTEGSPVELDTTLINNTMNNIIPIKLPASGTVQGRINAATNIPEGWTLSAGVNPIDLDITHNMGKRIVSVNVWYKTTGTIYQQARNFYNAYTDLYSLSVNEIRIGALYEGETDIVIYVEFEQ